MDVSSYTQYLRRIDELRSMHPDWRSGQTAFNALSEFDPALQNLLRGTRVDPFYDDSRLLSFLERVHACWFDEVRVE